MNRSKKSIERIVERVMAEGMDRVHMEDLDQGRMVTASIRSQHGAVSMRFGESYTLYVSHEDARALGEALLRISQS